MKPKKKKKPALSTLRNRLDTRFSAWIRARDANEDGFGFCITCGGFTLLQCGHFIPRQHTATRWDDRNSHGQCSRCNKWLHANLAEYYAALQKRYGQAVVDELMALKHQTAKLTRSDLESLLERYS